MQRRDTRVRQRNDGTRMCGQTVANNVEAREQLMHVLGVHLDEPTGRSAVGTRLHGAFVQVGDLVAAVHLVRPVQGQFGSFSERVSLPSTG